MDKGLTSLLHNALALHQQGHIEQALELYSQALTAYPPDNDVLLFSAIAFCQVQNYSRAVKLFAQIDPTHVAANPSYHINYGLALSETGDFEHAIERLKAGGKLDPTAFEVHFNLGRCYYRLRKLKEAQACFAQALQQLPSDPQALAYQGAVLVESGDNTSGLELLKSAFTLGGETTFLRCNTALAFERRGELEEAQKQYERALALSTTNTAARLGLSRTLALQGKYQQATSILKAARSYLSGKDLAIIECNLSTIAHLQSDNDQAEVYAAKALELDPDSAEAAGLLGLAYSNTNRALAAVSLFKQATEVAAPNPMHLINMSKNYTSIGMPKEAITTAQRAYALDTANADAFSSLLLYLHYPSDIARSDITSLHLDYGRVFGQQHTTEHNTSVNSSAERPRLGFISGDFCVHPIQFFFEPLLKEAALDNRIDILLYSNTPKKDQVTQRYISYVTKFVDIRQLNDTAACQLIAADNLDALIDLSGHTNNNRLGILAAKPAKKQLTYLGYPDTTGLQEIDYRITDNYADPAGSEKQYSEELLRLEDCFLTYLPPAYPEPRTKDSAEIVFGSFNNIAKISDVTVQAWSEILKQVPQSILLLKCHGLSETDLDQILTPRFNAYEIKRERLVYASRQPDFQQHLELYNRIDIALDTFPYNGTTTTFEALLMGRPVITRRTNSHVSSVGQSIMQNLKKTEFIAHSFDEYVKQAVLLAQDPQRITRLHQSLSKNLLQSTLCNNKAFYKKFIAALTKMKIIFSNN